MHDIPHDNKRLEPVSHATTVIPDGGSLATELACYLSEDAIEVTLSGMHAIEHGNKAQYSDQYNAHQFQYKLALGNLQLLALTLYLPFDTDLADIETARMSTVKAVLAWYKTSLAQKKDSVAVGYDAFIFDIQLVDEFNKSNSDSDEEHSTSTRLKHHFGVHYFLEELVVDMSDSSQQLQMFSWHDWRSITAAVKTPCELWRFLGYHLKQLQHSVSNHDPSFDSEKGLVARFLQSPDIFAPAIAVDNALIKNEVQDEPNPALVAMMLAYKNHSTTAQMYHQHMEQAAILWSQLSMQMIEMYGEKQITTHKNQSDIPLAHWQQQLLDESLFSRHELIRALYRHPKQSASLQKDGYVIHQHSYESLGRHYVLVFYGQEDKGHNSKAVVQPNLAKIAQDVATRLPIMALHHVVVLGIDFITEDNETFIDIDLWIQPIGTMTQRERQLTKQVQQLKKQSIDKQHIPLSNKPAHQNLGNQKPDNQQPHTKKLPQVHLSLTIPARKDTP